MKPEHFSIELMFPCPECGDVIGTFVPLETYTQDVNHRTALTARLPCAADKHGQEGENSVHSLVRRA
jgi:hypothetical protein